MNCSLCDGHQHTRVADTDSKSGAALDVFLCDSCGLIQQLPIPTEEDLKEYYAKDYRIDYKQTRYPKSKHVFRSAYLASQRLGFLMEFGIRPATLLDIGAGSGEFVTMAARAGFRAEGIEPNLGYSTYARSQYGVPVMTGDLDTAHGSHDVVSLFHVLEHLRSPCDVFRRLHQLVSPGGRLFVEVPWILSGSVSPTNRYFKAHLYYFDVETLAAAASPYFEVVGGRNQRQPANAVRTAENSRATQASTSGLRHQRTRPPFPQWMVSLHHFRRRMAEAGRENRTTRPRGENPRLFGRQNPRDVLGPVTR